MTQRGFTLLEVLIALGILTTIVAIVYASFATVVNTTEATRAQAQELRMRQLLMRSFQRNFSTVYADIRFEDSTYAFVGTDAEGTDGPQDGVYFCATVPVMGGMSLPGELKQVRYEMLGDLSDLGFDLDEEPLGRREMLENGEESGASTLVLTETPLFGADVSFDELKMTDREEEDFFGEDSYTNPELQWENIRTFDLKYFDGEEWVDQWDSVEYGRMPWCVHVRINFVKSDLEEEADKDAGYDEEEDPDFEMIIAIPLGSGVYGEPVSEIEEGADEEEDTQEEEQEGQEESDGDPNAGDGGGQPR